MNHSSTIPPSLRTRNRGINWSKELTDKKPTDYRFGATSPQCIALIPLIERVDYLPAGELQRGMEDFMDCATRSPVNELEAKFTWLYKNGKLSPANRQWLIDKGYVDQNGRVTFSDRFIAIKSGTTRDGNSLIAPLQAIHSRGLIPKKMLPANKYMTFDMYHRKSDITIEMEILAFQFKDRFPIGYEEVSSSQFPTAIATDMIGVAGFAWPEPVNGVYPKTEGPFNHAFLDYASPSYNIYDNYPEGTNDWTKKLAPDYVLSDWGYRLYIAENAITKDREFIDIIIDLCFRGKVTDALSLVSKHFGSWLGAH